jgi:Holliday junction resolvase RusA-like endonuclease
MTLRYGPGGPAQDGRGEIFATRFIVPGVPTGQPRHRSRIAKTGAGRQYVQTYEAGVEHPVHGWKDALVRYALPHRPATPLTGPVQVGLWFRFAAPRANISRPATAPRLRRIWHTSKPDPDNLAKAVLDVLQEVGYFASDAQVAGLGITKCWVLPGGASEEERPGVSVELKEMAA